MDPHATRRVDTRHPLFMRLAALAATVFAGLLACGALLAAVGGLVPDAMAAPAVTTRNFPGAFPCDTSLQACIDGSSPGDTIVIQTGTYTVGVTLYKRVNLTGVNSGTVFLNALANQRVLTVTGVVIDNSTVISGLTFSGGHAAGAFCPEACGGAIYISDTAQPQLVNLTIQNNLADANGGGVYAELGSPLALSGLAVLSNTATNGHAGGLFAVDDMTVDGGLFLNNQCLPGACFGGAIYSSGSVTVSSATFISNTSGRGGGAIFAGLNMADTASRFQSNHCVTAGACSGGALMISANMLLAGTQVLSNVSTSDGGGARAGGLATLTGVVFRNNQGGDSVGGGLVANTYLVATDTQFVSNTTGVGAGGVYAAFGVTMTRGLFQDNQCTDVSCKGGGLWVRGAMALTNTVFLNNHGQQGGAIYHSVTGGFGGSDGRLVNDLFAGNFADDNGQALFLVSPGQVTLLHTTIASPTLNTGSAVFVGAGTVTFTNTLLANHAVGIENSAGTVTEDYSLFSAVATPTGGVVGGGTHSHPGAAGFVDPTQNNYHLATGSAAIDAGVDAGINFDIDGDLRPMRNGFDIGFDEARNQLYLALVHK